MRYAKHKTALIIIDPYNDFISEGGKVWNRIKSVAEATSWPRSIGVQLASRTPTWICSSRNTAFIIVIGLIAHTCVEATVRYAAELAMRLQW